MSDRTRVASPLRDRAFRLLVTGQLASNLGDGVSAVALPWYVLARHGGAVLLSTMLAVYGTTRIAGLLVGGRLSDRWRPWTVMTGADLTRAIAALGFVIAADTGPPRFIVLAPIAGLLGVGSGLFMPASFAVAPALLSGEALQAANGLLYATTQAATLVGPAAGGALVALAGAVPGLAVDSASFLVSAVSLIAVGARRRAAVALDDGAADGADDAPPTLGQMIRTERIIAIILLVNIAANLGAGGLGEVALPALAHGPFHAGATGYGAMLAAFGGGGLAGALLAGQTATPRRPAVVASIAFLVSSGFLAVAPYLGGVVPAAAMLLLWGVLLGYANVLTMTALQRWAPPALLGRLMSVVLLGSLGVFPVSVLLGGLVTHSLGPAVFLPLAAASLAVAVVGSLCTRTWREFGARLPSAS